jgi:hypothetical protein
LPLISIKNNRFLYFIFEIKNIFDSNNNKTPKMKNLRLTLFVCTMLLINNLSYAQTEDPGDIQPDRPGLGESSQIVPLKYFQIEAGGNFEFDKENNISAKSVTYNATTLRYGIFENFELRLAFNFAQEFVKVGSFNANSKLGFTPWSLGFKARICEAKGIRPSAAILGNLAIPYPAASFYKTAYIAPSILIPMEWDLTESLLLTVNVGSFWDGNGPVPSYFSSLGFDYALPSNFGVFVEGYMNVDETGDFQPGFNGGVVWRLLPNLQFDLSAGVGLNAAMADGFINGGISYRIPK